ncbi:Toxin-antitoxin system, toxin component, HicA-like [Desulfonema limicola]|uniref:Toxin-antitoxin system, toxin component, HicA-like n=1 Tax=Desulfonema limicola TaxID=45656 RepID=A0A975BDF8_9BACT|nr:type II toxin-antitoxin system HicA family toxin [Desulfonema limicola]QTA83268.1 Toxin-antitoxin system, toxin component, HicA-like [Desulfonema limicola]
MSEKLPAVTGRNLIRFLEGLGYEAVRQRGSHIRLTKNTLSGKHKITIPNHDPVAKGTLSDILGKVSLWCQIPKDELVKHLRNK